MYNEVHVCKALCCWAGLTGDDELLTPVYKLLVSGQTLSELNVSTYHPCTIRTLLVQTAEDLAVLAGSSADLLQQFVLANTPPCLITSSYLYTTCHVRCTDHFVAICTSVCLISPHDTHSA